MSRTVFWNNDEPTQIAYELKVEDFTQAYTPHRKTKTWWLVFRILLSIGALFVAVVLFGFLLKPSWPMAKALIPLLLLVPMWIAVLCLLPWWSMRRQFPQQPGAHGPRSLTLDDGGMHCRWNGGSSDIEWKNYIGSVEGKNQILSSPPQQLQHPSQTPFRREQLDELRAMLKQDIRVVN